MCPDVDPRENGRCLRRRCLRQGLRVGLRERAQLALECYVAAQKAKDPVTRDAYLELMRNWRDLADEIERFEHAWLDREGI